MGFNVSALYMAFPHVVNPIRILYAAVLSPPIPSVLCGAIEALPGNSGQGAAVGGGA